MRQLDLSSLPPIDALAFGFPCNDFSVVGEQKGFDGTYGPLYTYGVSVLKSHKPKWFLAENVGGLKSANEGNAFQKILNDMRAAGYRLYPNLYKFEQYGVPQARHRIIIVGIREDLPYDFKIPSPEPYSSIDNSCRNALENPPIPVSAPNSELTRQSPQVVERLKYIKPGENAFTAKTASHVCKLLEKYGFQTIWGRSNVQEVLGLKPTRSTALLKEMAEKGVVEPVTGFGKGKFRFRQHEERG